MDLMDLVDPVIAMSINAVTIYTSVFGLEDSDNVENDTIANSTSAEFQSHFRITHDSYEWLFNTIEPRLQRTQKTGREMINPNKQILVVLWLLATPDSYRSVGNRFNMGKSSLFVRFCRVIRVINEVAPSLIAWPSGETAVANEEKFYRMANIRGVVGAVDGTYVPIKAPPDNPEVYMNRKCFYGITLQCISDGSLKFIDCFTGYPSSVSDIRIFRNSYIYQEISEHPNDHFPPAHFIIGDKAYPLLTWCVTPYIARGRLQQWQTFFNSAHAKTRQVVERSFALLFGRFRRLKYLDMNRVDLIPATIIAACVLHNVCLNRPDDLIAPHEAEGRHFRENNGAYFNPVNDVK